MPKRKPKDVTMHVTVYFRDALKDAIAAVNKQFPHHTITHFEEAGHDEVMEQLREEHAWHGPYDHWPLQWEFVVEKQDPDAPGPSRAEVTIHPMFDVIFKDFDDVFIVEIGFEDEPATIKVAGADSPAIEAYVFYQPGDDI